MAGSNTDAFEAIMASLDDAMWVVSVCDGSAVAGCLVGFATQCSIEPPRFLVCLSKQNRTYQVAQNADVLVTHRLRDDQKPIAEYVGGTSAKDDPFKLARLPWTPGPEGAPVLDDTDWFAGRVLDRVDVGDHVAFLLEPFAGACRGGSPLGYQEARDIEAGQPAG